MSPVANSRCEATTKTHGTQCVNGGAEWCAFNKKMLCHLHRPDGRYRQQVNAKRGFRMTTRREQDRQPADLYHGSRKPFRSDFMNGLHVQSRAERDQEFMPKDQATPMLDRPLSISPDAGRDPHYRLSRHRTEPEE